MKKENKFESRYGISKKTLKKMFRNLAVDTAGSVEKEHAMDIYKEDAGEMMFGYIDEWNLMEDCDERASMALCNAFSVGYMMMEDILGR